MNKTILIIDACNADIEPIKSYLTQQNFNVLVETNGDRAPARILECPPDLVLIDDPKIGKDAFEICAEVRNTYPKPIFLYTHRSDPIDEIVALELGVDAYAQKSIPNRLLLARIKNCIRRYEQISSDSIQKAIPPKGMQEVESLQIDYQKRTAIVDNKPIPLTKREFDFLSYFFANRGIILTREELHQQLMGTELSPKDRSIDLRISRLRSKLNDTGRSPRFIHSIRGVGYMLAP